MFLRSVVIFESVCVLLLMGAGCSFTQTPGAQILNRAVQELSGGKVSANLATEQMVFTEEKTGDMIAFGENVKLPKEFPQDIPIYQGAKISGVTMSKQHDQGTSITLTSDDSPEKVIVWYSSAFAQKGFQEDKRSISGSTEIRNFINKQVSIVLTVSANGSKKSSSLLTLIRSEK
jgi:hypothetical protein